MEIYQTKSGKLKGTDFHEVWKKANTTYLKIKRRTKRRPYIRSAYFRREKVFINLFWTHLFDKQKWQDRFRRLKYFEAGIELIRNSKLEPISKENPNKKGEILHRFTGLTKENDVFYVQVKEIKSTGSKYLISIFPEHKRKTFR